MSQERVGITVEVKGGQEALDLMRQLDSAVKKLNGTKININLGNGQLQGLVSATQQTDKLAASTQKAQAQQKTLGDAMRTTFNRISSVTMHTGQQMQVLGKTLTQISSPMRTLFRSTVWAAGFKALNTVTQGFADSLSRYDVMKNYSRTLEAFGFSAKEATTAIGELEQSVLGLPTGLDEIVAVQKRFLASSQDMKKATGLAIAYNNAILASGSDARQQKTAQRIITQLAGGAEIASSSWDALQRAIPLVFTQLAKEANMKVPDYMAALKSGQIATEEFTKAFTQIGTEGSIQDAANVMKMSFEGLTANITNAAKRMGEGVIKAFDEVFQGYNGRSLLQNLLGVDQNGKEIGGGIKHIINDFSASLQEWIKANPDFFLDFLNTLKNFDWAGLVRGVGQGIQQTVQDVQKLFDLFNKFTGGNAEGIGRFMARAPLYGRLLVVSGGMLKGMRGIIAAVGTAVATPALAKGAKMGGIFGILGKLLGKADDAEDVATTARVFPTFKESLQGMVSGLANAIKAFGTIAIAAGTGFVVFKSFKSMFSDLKAMIDIAKSIDWDIAKEIGTGMAVFIGSFATLGAVLGGTELGAVLLAGEAILGAITTLASGIFALDMHLVKKGFESFKKITDYLKEGMENLSTVTSHSVPTNTIERAIESFNEVYNMLKPKYQGQGIQNMNTRIANKMKDNMAAMVDVIKGVVDFQKVIGEIEELGTIPSNISQKIQDIFTELGNIHESISSSFATKAHVSQAKDASSILDNTKKMFDSIIGKDGIIAQIGTIGSEIPKIAEGATQKLKLGKKTFDTKKSKSLIEQAREGLSVLFEGLEGIYTDISGFEAKGGTTNRTANAATTIENVQKMFDSIVGKEGVIGLFKKLGKQLPEIVSGGYGGTQSIAGQVRDYLKDMFASLGDIYESIVSEDGLGMYQSVTKGSSNTATEIFSNVQAMFSSLLGKEGIISQITKLYETLPNIVSGGYGGTQSVAGQVKDYLKDMFSSLNELYDYITKETGFGDEGGMESFSESIGKLPQIMTDIQTAVNTISGMGKSMGKLAGEDGSFPIVGQIKNMISQLSQAFSAETISTLQAQVEGFKSTINSLLQSISSMVGMSEGNPLEVAITITHTIKETASDAIRDAAMDIRRAWATVPTSLTRQISVTISASVSTGGAISAIRAGAARVRAAANSAKVATGGYISTQGQVLYRSRGGEAFLMKPRGTDTVPAMLTPGEYVHRKKAVDFFGIDFMRKVNHLDVRGAIESLMSRASGMSGIGRQTVVNNTYNNNQKVVQNINTNSPDFAFKSASRFAGAF